MRGRLSMALQGNRIGGMRVGAVSLAPFSLRLEGTAEKIAGSGLPSALLGFAFPAALGFGSGGYWPTAWGWSALVLFWIAALLFLVKAEVRLGALERTVPLALCGLVAWNLVSALWASSLTQPMLEAQRGLVYASGTLVALLVVRRSSYRAFIGGIWLAITLVCTYGLATRLFPERLGSINDLEGYRLASPLGYWNAFGIFAVLGILLALGLVARARSPVMRSIAAVSAVLLLPALYFTYSRGSWIALGVGLVVAIALDRNRVQLVTAALAVGAWSAAAVWVASQSEGLTRAGTKLEVASRAGHRYALLLLVFAAGVAATAYGLALVERHGFSPAVRRSYAGALALLLVAGLAAVFVRFGSPATIVRDSYNAFTGKGPAIMDGDLNRRLFNLSGSGRNLQWRVGWREYEMHPWLGSGAGTYERHWNQYRPVETKIRDAHSLYVEVLAETGPVGLSLLLVALCAPLAVALRARRRALGAAACGAYCAFLVHAGVDWDWEMPAVTLAALFCGVAIFACARGRAERRRLPTPVRFGAVAACLALAAFAFVGLQGNRAVRTSEEAAANRQWATSAAAASRAERWAPWSSQPWQLLGDAQFAQGQVDAARASFLTAISKDSEDWGIWLDLAVASDGALQRRAFAEAERLNPRSSAVEAYRARAGRRS